MGCPQLQTEHANMLTQTIGIRGCGCLMTSSEVSVLAGCGCARVPYRCQHVGDVRSTCLDDASSATGRFHTVPLVTLCCGDNRLPQPSRGCVCGVLPPTACGSCCRLRCCDWPRPFAVSYCFVCITYTGNNLITKTPSP